MTEKNRFERVGEFLKSRRLELELTQKQVGEALGYAKGQYVYFVESGKIDIPRGKLKKWLKILKVSPQEYIDLQKKVLEQELRSYFTKADFKAKKTS